MRIARTAPVTMPSAARKFSAWCAIACVAATRRPRRGRANWAGTARARVRKPSRTSRRSKPSAARERGPLLLSRAHFGHELLQLTALVHLERDVTAADQLALHVQLWVGGPVGVTLEPLAYFRLFENVHVPEVGAHGAQCRHRLRRKAALRKVRRALHEQHHRA